LRLLAADQSRPAQAVGIIVMGNATSYPIDSIAKLALAHA